MLEALRLDEQEVMMGKIKIIDTGVPKGKVSDNESEDGDDEDGGRGYRCAAVLRASFVALIRFPRKFCAVV